MLYEFEPQGLWNFLADLMLLSSRESIINGDVETVSFQAYCRSAKKMCVKVNFASPLPWAMSMHLQFERSKHTIKK